MEFSSGGVKKLLLKNRKRKKSLIPIIEQFLPFEIIIEILSWLPVKSLLRFKCVCKQWYSLIQDHQFIEKQSIRSKPVTYLYKIHPNTDEVDGENFKFVTCGYGLILEMKYASKKYRIRNPSTRQIFDIPDPQNISVGMELFNVPDTSELKVVSMFINDVSEDCEILTVGIDEQWRPLKLPSICNLGKAKCRPVLRAELGALHFIRLIADGSHLCMRVDSLEKGSECFSTFTLPQGIFSDLNKVFSMYWYCCLALAEIVEENLNVMVLENWKKQKWSERKIIVPLTFLKEDPGLKENLVLHAAQSNKLMFWKNEKQFLYNIKSRKITDVAFNPEGYISILTHRSLVTINGMQPEKTPTRDELVKTDQI